MDGMRGHMMTETSRNNMVFIGFLIVGISILKDKQIFINQYDLFFNNRLWPLHSITVASYVYPTVQCHTT